MGRTHGESGPVAAAAIVEPDAARGATLAGWLEDAGLSVRVFEGAKEALEAMTGRTPPDLVVTNLYLPGIDGWQLCQLLRSGDFEGFEKSRILVISNALADDDAGGITADLGADAVLPASVLKEAFLTRVRELLAGERLRTPLRAFIVSDDERLVDALAATLADHGHRVDASLSGVSAMERIRTDTFDLAVLESHLTDGNSPTLLSELHRLQPDCLCMVMTEEANPARAVEWMAEGAVAHLRKPFGGDRLMEIVARARRARDLLGTEALLAERTEALQVSDSRYRRLTENASAVFFQFRLDPDGCFSFPYVSDQILELAGVHPREVMKDASVLLGLLHPEDQPSFREAVHRSVTSMERYQAESRWLKDGETMWIEARSTPTALPGGGVLWDGFFTDITARKRAEEALKESTDQLRYSQRVAQMGSFVLDVGTGTWTGSEALDAVLGIAEAPYTRDMEGWSRIIHPEHREEMLAHLRSDVLGGGEPFDREFRILRANDGEERWVHGLGGVVGDAGGNVKVVGIIQDITARKRAEERLRRHHIFFEQMFAQSSVSTQILDKEGWCERINPKLSEIFGVEPEHMEGRVYNIFRDEAVRQGGIIPHLEKVFREGKAAEWEINFDIGVAAESQGIEVKEKKKAWYYNWAYPIFDADGALSHVIIQHTDITERKRREDERERLQGQVHQAQKMESVGRLAGGVAHDFNNMLSVILARSEFALEALDPADALYDDLKEIQQAGQRSADLTRQLLAFARMQAAVPRVLDLNDATDRMLNMLRTLLGENVSLVWRPGDDLWLVRVDGSQIDQILANLCVNARDAIADVGTVTVETANVTFDESSCAGHPERRVGEFVLLAITDDGHGMGEEVREHIFEPFFTTKQLGQGTGLGLATVYGIVQQNGGFISVRSEVGEGATLSVHLPRYYGQAQDDVPSFAEDRPRSRGETVLLVEDEAAILRLGRTMLERLGYEVLAAATPGEALRLAEQHAGRIDLLVTDVVMPEMNGRRLAERIGALVPDLKCLYMSGYTADVIADQGVLTEGIHFIQKPFTINGLAESVRTALGGRPGGGS